MRVKKVVEIIYSDSCIYTSLYKFIICNNNIISRGWHIEMVIFIENQCLIFIP